MNEAEFDKYALAYEEQHRRNIAITGEDPAYFAEYKIKLFSELSNSSFRNILDFGSGIGNSLPHFRKYLPDANLTCSDISQKSLDYAKKRFPGSEQMLKIDQKGIPAADASFDAVFSACVFHHIPHAEHRFWLEELRRVVKPGGTIAIFEHNPYNPLTQRAVNSCPFDENAVLITASQLKAVTRASGLQVLRVNYHLFFPKILAKLRLIEPMLTPIPIGAQYSMYSRRPE
jgi:ubiquinone/menaquinone biosynthesis C-methylase UbiE